MRSLVIYDSEFGNTAQIAQVIADALAPQGEVEIQKVDQITLEQVKGVDLLIVGSPTQAFRPTKAITEFLKEVSKEDLTRVQVAAFDTRISTDDIESPIMRGMANLFFGYAAPHIAKQLERGGGKLVAPPEGFIVEGKEGPLKEGERERAAEWVAHFAEINQAVASAV
jgi:flavodoxin